MESTLVKALHICHKRLSIDLSKKCRERKGFDSMIHWLPGLFNNDENYIAVNDTTIEMIAAQSSLPDTSPELDATERYSENVQVISKDEKLYYLPY